MHFKNGRNVVVGLKIGNRVCGKLIKKGCVNEKKNVDGPNFGRTFEHYE